MKSFFDSVRQLFGALDQAQVDWLDRLVTSSNGLPIDHQAYVLATAWHETGRFKYTHEIWGPTAQQRKYEPPNAKAKELGNTMKGDGKRFMGRGPAQLTGRRNYAKASKLVGVDFVANPDWAALPEYGSRILVSGMRDGWFTGKRMADYDNFRDMRRVVNGTDKAELIAGHALKFKTALQSLKTAQETAKAPPLAPETPKTDLPAVAPSNGPQKPSLQKVMVWIVMAIVAAIAALFGFGGN